MKRWKVISVAALAAAAFQWFTLAERIGHAVKSTWRVSDPYHATNVSLFSVVAFWIIVLPLLVATLYALDQLMKARSPFRWVAAVAAVCLAAGCLVFLGMLSSDIVWIRQA